MLWENLSFVEFGITDGKRTFYVVASGSKYRIFEGLKPLVTFETAQEAIECIYNYLEWNLHV